LFDPFEEQFDLPTLLVKRGNDGGGQCKIVRQEYEPLSSLRIATTNTPQMLRIVPPGIEPVERDALIGADARRFVDGMRINAVILHVAFSARDEKTSSLRQRTQSSKINIAAIHHVNGPSFRHDQIQRQRIAHFTVRNVDEARNGATQIKQRMQLDRCLGRTKM